MHGLRRYEYSVIGNETYFYCLLGDAAVVFLGFVLHIVSAARAELAYSAFRTDMRQRSRSTASGRLRAACTFRGRLSVSPMSIS